MNAGTTRRGVLRGALALCTPCVGAAVAAVEAGPRAPAFVLPQLDAAAKDFVSSELRGRVWVLNAWASWCGPCRTELPVLQALADRRLGPIIGLNQRDKREQAQAWLAKFGNPYSVTVLDADGQAGGAFSIASLPATFVIDRQGVVRLSHAGPLTDEQLRGDVLPLIERLRR